MNKFNVLILKFLFFFLFNCEEKIVNKESKINKDNEIGYVSFCNKMNDSIKENKFIEFIKEFKHFGNNSPKKGILLEDNGIVKEVFNESCKTIHSEDKNGNIIGAKEYCTREPDRKTKQFVNKGGELYLKEFNMTKKITVLLCDVVFIPDGQNYIYLSFNNFFSISHHFSGIAATYIDESVFIKNNHIVKNDKRDDIQY